MTQILGSLMMVCLQTIEGNQRFCDIIVVKT